MMQQSPVIGRIIIILWLLLAVFSYLFFYTQGLAYSDSDSVSGISYVNELQSSGGDDNICIEIGVAFAIIALLWGFLRYRAQSGLADFTINAVLIGLQMLYILSIEAGSVIDTIVLGKNFILMLWVLTYAALCCSIFAGFITIIVSRKSTRAT